MALEKWPHWLNISLITAVALLLIGFFLQTELALTDGQLGAPLDDAWIHFQFARNLSQGHGFSFNPGEPTPGSTAPLWTLLLAGVGLFTQDFLVPSLLLSAGFYLLAVGLTYGITFDLTGDRFTGLLAGLGVAVTGRMLWAGLAGMETTAFAALSLAAVWAYTRWGLRPLPALLFGLAGQIRPEGHALFALAAVVAAWQGLFVDRQSMVSVAKQLFSAGIIYLIVAAPYAIFSLFTTGFPLPNTFYAKVSSEHLFSWRTLRETIRLHWYDNPFSLILLPFGLGPVWRRGRLTAAWLLALPVLTAVIIDFVWHHGRYTMPLIPFQMITAAVGAHWLLTRIKSGSPSPAASRRFPLLVLLMTILFVAGGLWQIPAWAKMLGNNTREILDIDVALGHWLAQNTPPEALIAVDDIGAITYISERRIVDMNGLVSPEMWPAVRQPVGLPRNQVAARILSELNPEIMVGFPLWHWEIAMNTAVSEPMYRVQTETHTMIAEQEAVVYRVSWPYVAQASPQFIYGAKLGEAIALMGYDLDVDERRLLLTLYWHSLTSVTAPYEVFVHVLNDAGEIIAQVDRQPALGLAPTDLWRPNDIVRDRYQLDLPPDLPTGSCSIKVGMYLRETGVRLPVHGVEHIDNAILLTLFSQGP